MTTGGSGIYRLGMTWGYIPGIKRLQEQRDWGEKGQL